MQYMNEQLVAMQRSVLLHRQVENALQGNYGVCSRKTNGRVCAHGVVTEEWAARLPERGGER